MSRWFWSDVISQNQNRFTFVNDEGWVVLSELEQCIKHKIETLGIPLRKWNINIYRGILTGYNEAFIIDKAKREALIKEDPNSVEIIRPLLRGRDIKKYSFDFANLWLINVHNGINGKGLKPIEIDDYPAVKKHLDLFKSYLDKRLDKGVTPYHLRNCAYMDDFSKQKIVWGEISDLAKFAIEPDGSFVCEATSFLMTGSSLEYLTCFLNSKLSAYLFSKIGTTTGVGTIRWKKYTIEQLYVPQIDKLRELEYINALKQILHDKSDKDKIQAHIDHLIFEDANLSLEEINFIEHESAK